MLMPALNLPHLAIFLSLTAKLMSIKKFLCAKTSIRDTPALYAINDVNYLTTAKLKRLHEVGLTC
jgi:hypothetical protein